MLCTLTDLKTRIGIDSADTAQDDLLTALIAGFTAAAEGYCGRALVLTAEDVTEYYSGVAEFLCLRRYPVVEITSVKEAIDWDFDSATALVADSDYRLVGSGEKGILYRCYGKWSPVPDSIQVVYRGGFLSAEPGEGEPVEGEIAMPADLQTEAINQCSFLYKRKDDLGLSGVSFQGGSFNKFADLDLLPTVRQTLDRYRRLVL